METINTRVDINRKMKQHNPNTLRIQGKQTHGKENKGNKKENQGCHIRKRQL